MTLRRLRGALAGAAFLLSGSAQAGGLTVSPLRLEFNNAREVRSLSISNTGSETLRVQISATRWTQDTSGADVDEDTRDLLVTPPLFELPPGARQTVRAGLRRAPDPRGERAYHLYVREVQDHSTAEREGLALRFRLQHALPVFVAPRAGLRDDLHWDLAPGAQGRTQLFVHNTGAAHGRITRARLLSVPAGDVLLDWKGVFYALPGERLSSSLTPLPIAAGTPLRLELVSGIDGANQTREVSLTAP